jgi:hypothetical protein
MSTLHEGPVTVQSHPYRPELSLLRHYLGAQEYTENARDRIVSYAASQGTLEGAPELEPGDSEGAELAYVEGMEPVPSCSPEWDEHATGPDGAPVYIDLQTLLEGGSTANLFAAIAGSYLDMLTDEQIDALAAELDAEDDLEPIDSDAPDAGRSWSEHFAELIATGRASALPRISGGAPYEPTAEDWADMGEWCAAVEAREAARRERNARHNAKHGE